MAIERRRLDFRSYDALLADVARLRDQGYDRAGNWQLPQILAHLARTMDVVVDRAAKPMPRPLRWVARRLALPWVLKRRRMPTGVPIPPMVRDASPTPPAPDVAAAALEAAIARARAHAGPTIGHPALGTIALDDWHQLQLIHAAHHLSFLVPRG